MFVFENIECGQKSICNIDILTAMRWVSTECTDLTAATINNCFNLLFVQCRVGKVEVMNSDLTCVSHVCGDMLRIMGENEVKNSRMAVNNLLNTREKDDVYTDIDL